MSEKGGSEKIRQSKGRTTKKLEQKKKMNRKVEVVVVRAWKRTEVAKQRERKGMTCPKAHPADNAMSIAYKSHIGDRRGRRSFHPTC